MKFEMTHTCLRVLDLEKSVKFYKEELRLKETKRVEHKENGFTLVYLSDKYGGYEIELTYNYEQKGKYELGNGYSHMAFYVDDAYKARELHLSHNIEATQLKIIKDRYKIYFITDPDGYKVELIERME